MNEAAIREYVRNGESDVVEFKTGIRDPAIIARNVSAFANASGGTVLVGIDERHGIVGCDRAELKRAFETSQRLLSGDVEVTLDFVTVDGKNVGVISVSRSPDLVSSRDGIFIRRGEATLAMAASVIRSRLPPDKPPLDRLTELIADQTKRIEELVEIIRRSGSWKAKAVDYVVGGIVGTIIGVIVTFLLTGASN